MPRVLLAGARLPIERLNAHVLTSDRATFPIQLVAQHARAHERMLQVQRVKATHAHQIGRADRLGLIVGAARLIPGSCAWRLIDSAWVESIIALRSALPPW